MNLLEHYILEVISVNILEQVHDYVSVTMIVNCYGHIYKDNKVFRVEEWKEAQEKGYYVA